MNYDDRDAANAGAYEVLQHSRVKYIAPCYQRNKVMRLSSVDVGSSPRHDPTSAQGPLDACRNLTGQSFAPILRPRRFVPPPDNLRKRRGASHTEHYHSSISLSSSSLTRKRHTIRPFRQHAWNPSLPTTPDLASGTIP